MRFRSVSDVMVLNSQFLAELLINGQASSKGLSEVFFLSSVTLLAALETEKFLHLE